MHESGDVGGVDVEFMVDRFDSVTVGGTA